ncbi:MAG: hypothetical protein AB1631_29545 [Acidobacteriota bacterium]
MLNGLEATEVKLSDLDLGDRLDAEYVSKESLLISKRLHERPTRKLGELGKFAVSAFYPAATHLYAEGDVPFMRCVDCINHPVISRSQDESFERIPSSFLAEHSSIDTVGKGDLIITKVGSPCYASIVHEHDELALSRTVMGLKGIAGINPYYLLAFLRSYYGFNQLLRQRELTIQYQLTVERVKDVDIFLPTIEFQSIIESIVKAAHQKLEQSKSLYAEAESLLLDELGLKDWQPSDENTAVKSFTESLGSTGRIDAEYYQPRYQKAMSILNRSGKRIGDVATLAKDRFTPTGLDSFNYIEIGNLSGDGSAEAEKILIEDTPSRAQWIVKTNDVITSTVRPIRRLSALIEADQNGFVCSSGFAVLRPKAIKPELLLVFLRAPIVCEILDLHTTASMYPAISTEDLLQIPITSPSETISNQIVQRVRKSRSVKRESKRLLNIARRGVEIAIEKDEQTALKWIEKNQSKG